MSAVTRRFSYITFLVLLVCCGPGRVSAQRIDSLVFGEAFEHGNKSTYSPSGVVLDSGPWWLDSAVNGKSTKDRKTGRASLRLQPGGHATTLFDFSERLTVLRFRIASYGQDSSSIVSVWTSNDQGATWNLQGSRWKTVPTLSTAEVRITAVGRFLLRIRNEGPFRVNLDDLELLARKGTKSKNGPWVQRNLKSHDDPLSLGNPSHANQENRDNYLIVHPQYSLSYNATKGRANWVAWHLSLDWEGNADRCDCFLQDTSLPAAFYRAVSSDYINSGFDRGHLCPSDDRSANAVDNAATFLMSNIVPQAPNLNRLAWKDLESYSREISSLGNEMYIFAGVYGRGGIGQSRKVTTTIAKGKLEVPARFWKIIVILPKADDDLSRIGKGTRIIAVDMPNDQKKSDQDWRNFRCSVSDIEQATGLRFFDALPIEIVAALRERVDTE